MPAIENQRERMRGYIRDMAAKVAVSTHKDILNEAQISENVVFEIASLAAEIALQKYDAENRTVVAQAESFERMVQERNATRVPLHFLTPGALR